MLEITQQCVELHQAAGGQNTVQDQKFVHPNMLAEHFISKPWVLIWSRSFLLLLYKTVHSSGMVFFRCWNKDVGIHSFRQTNSTVCVKLKEQILLIKKGAQIFLMCKKKFRKDFQIVFLLHNNHINHFNKVNLWNQLNCRAAKLSPSLQMKFPTLSVLICTIKFYKQTQFPVYFLCHMQLQWTRAQIISFQPFNPNQILTREW